MKLEFADLSLAQDAADLVMLLDAYARDPVGGGLALSAEVKERLVRDLAGRAGTLVLLAKIGAGAVGAAIAFEGYSTFAAAPLLNVHDVIVLPAYRGRGIAAALLERLESEARAAGCCKLTLEVLEENQRARRVYARAGFEDHSRNSAFGRTLFLQKRL
jgi:GNAT superfamily N-acetyltransferase